MSPLSALAGLAPGITIDTGIITRVAGSGRVGWGGNGGPALECEIDNDSGIAVDHDGNVFLSCEWSNVASVSSRRTVAWASSS